MTRVQSALARSFVSLRVRNFRLYFVGQVISFTGTWMQSVAQAWLVLRLTGSGVDLGAVTALQFLPMLLAGPWAGVVADRVDKRKLVILTQTCSGLLALTLGLLTVTGVVTLWSVYALALGLGVVTLFDNPARQVFIMEMVGTEDIANAVSLNGVVVNASRVVGPAAAGLLIASVGIGPCFLINAASYIAVVVGLFMMRPGDLHRDVPAVRRRGQLREGFRYVWRNHDLLVPLFLMAVVGTLAYNFSVVFPLLVRFSFGRGAQTYGTLFSLMGLGAVVGGLVVASRNRASRGMLVGAALALGAALWLAALAPNLMVEMVAMVPIGAASTAFIAMSNATLQLGSDPQMRGRVMALFSMVFLGTTPLGGPAIGWVAQRFGPRAALGVGAGATVLASAGVLLTVRWLKRSRRRAEAQGEAAAQAEAVATKIGAEVGCLLPPGGSTLTASAENVPPSVAGDATVPPRGAKVPAGRKPAAPTGWNHSS